jgi:carbamoyl-phosphate synthase large subunit
VPEKLLQRLKNPHPERILYVKDALREGHGIDDIFEVSGIDPWFVRQIEELIAMEQELAASTPLRRCILHTARARGIALPFDKQPRTGDGYEPGESDEREALDLLRRAKRSGFSDRQVGWLTQTGEEAARAWRLAKNLRVAYKCVDTCGGEFVAETPYYYSTYEPFNESKPSGRKKIVILGGGPNRIGQGIEFDYCCVHAVFALREEGFETIMVNSNPETVSTDYDISDKLYFEPLTVEDVLSICELEKPDGVIVQFGGQTPLNLARALERAGVPILGTSPDSIDLAEDRGRFGDLLNRLGILQPANGWGRSFEEVRAVAQRIGYPVMVRPSYVLGGRAMEIVYTEEALAEYMLRAVEVSPDHPVLVDQFLQEATEVDVDALCDGERVVIGAIMEHIEAAGIHSGDSACVIPTRTLPASVLRMIRSQTEKLGLGLGVRGLMNIQFAVKDHQVYVLEVNPRASRTTPYVSKATGVPLAKLAAKIMAGRRLEELGFTREPEITHYAVKEVVLPYKRFAGCQITLGPEMRSTGEVMGIDPNFGLAFAKAEIAAGLQLPREGGIFISIADADKADFLPVAETLRDLGLCLIATPGTSRYLKARGVPNRQCEKISVGRPNIIDHIINREVRLIINTSSGPNSSSDEQRLRVEAIARDIPLITTIAAARAAAAALQALMHGHFAIRALQDYHAELRAATEAK